MPLIIEAIYEDGVLKTTMPLPFKEHEKVQLEVVQTAPRFAELLGFATTFPMRPRTLRRSTTTTCMAPPSDKRLQ